MKKSILLILSLLLFIPSVYALDECTPSDEYLEYLKLSEEERANLMPPYECKEMLNLNENSLLTNITRDLTTFVGTSVNTSRYNAVSDSIVSPVQNQYNDGTCWAFSALSVVETNAMKNGLPSYNLSEAHMAYTLIDGLYSDMQGRSGKYHSTADGGKITYPASYFFNNQGMLLESDLRYPNQLPSISSSNYIQGRHILSVDNFQTINVDASGACSNNEIFNLKKSITENGSVQGTMNIDEDLLKNNKYYYSQGLIGVNHAVTIVGWDDNISKDYFGASRDGAWIVKNSWGTDWGDNGYFYISYDDDHICQGAVSYNGVNSIEYDYTYKSADMVGTTFVDYVPLTYIASRFTKKSSDKEVIKKISFASAYADYATDYSIYITYDDNWKNDKNWKLIGTSSSNNLGIESIYLNEEIESDYTIIIKYLAKTSFYMITTTQNDDTYSLSYPKGVNYISTTNMSTWTDMGDMFIASAPNIFVYTDDDIVDTSTITVEEIEEKEDHISINFSNDDHVNISSVIITDLNGNDVTSNFIVLTYNDYITISNRNVISGHFDITITDENNHVCYTNYVYVEEMNLPSNIKLDEESGILYIPSNYKSTDILSNIVFKNTTILVYDADGNILSDDLIGSGSYLKTQNHAYYLIVKGDANGDAAVDSADLLKIVKYLKGVSTLGSLFQLSADVNGDDSIDSADLLKIVKYLKGVTTL